MRSFGRSVLFWSLGGVIMPMLVLMASYDAMARQGGYFYVGLDYSPTFVNIRNFSIGESSGETRGIYPYLRDGDTVKLEANRFNWNGSDLWIGFNDNMFVAMGGSAGYGMGSTRVEVEIGYERFKTKSMKDSEKDEADTVYLLAKVLAHDVVSGEAGHLAAALAKVSGKDIVYFANSLKSWHSGIEERICKGTSSGESGLMKGDEKAGNCNIGVLVLPDSSPQLYTGPRGLLASLGEEGSKKWPNINNKLDSEQYTEQRWTRDKSRNTWASKQGKVEDTNYQRDASDTVANDIKELDGEAREIVAQFLMRTIEGAEVVEINGISSTSFIVNLCSDIVAEDFVAVPYACLGLGGNIIEFVEGRSDLRAAYKLKVGLSYQLSQKVNAFADVFYHRVLGNGEYSDLPVRHLVHDHSPEGRSKNAATANFDMRYTGGEFGVRLAF
ncbi:P44/Msp2 family outer membrane protein [Anaplasma phagocytophilum]|uniref:MSP2 family outer membrane protein n=1 Tax=Anaplasma phagocytophilum str. CRT38 TaxID=1269275 RepID=S6GB40_ANAPH|nr:P44/Msp2 family outer membrane protein [Anaplasma phagocytophilum]EOA62783.1 MSP2 family outer membrane protein [Anaplasma phagocytophilum str. CRT38]KDB55707.1 P44-1 outer membrane protein [Anaplasma phagocytophilum str. CRT35]